MFAKTARLEHVNKLALKYFISCLQKSSRAQQYLYDRISPKTAQRYYVGYAPREGLVALLNEHGVKEKDARDLGLVTTDYDGYSYDRFQNRIMLPIIHAGRLLGFGGRTLGNDDPKYLNSKASLLYNKSDVLYGLFQARMHISKTNFALLVEGYFDVLTPVDCGIKQCVASCGTALTKEQARILKRYTSRVFVMYDGDFAGRKATKRAREILKHENIFAGIVRLPKEHDPASYIKENSKQGLLKLITRAYKKSAEEN